MRCVPPPPPKKKKKRKEKRKKTTSAWKKVFNRFKWFNYVTGGGTAPLVSAKPSTSLSKEAIYTLRVMSLCARVLFLAEGVSCCILLEFEKFSLSFLFLFHCITSFTIPLDPEYLPSTQKWCHGEFTTFCSKRDKRGSSTETLNIPSAVSKMFLIHLSHGRSFLVFRSHRHRAQMWIENFIFSLLSLN